MKRALPFFLLICLLCTLHVHAQTITRQDKLFIQRGILYESWVRNDHASEAVPVPNRQPLVIGRSGRYVRIQLPNTEVLSLAEVQVFSGGVNVALNKATQQSSDKQANSGLSPLAVDGNTDGVYTDGSVTHTIEGYAQMEPWWQVDLGSSVAIDSVVIWNRTDCCGSKLKGFFLFVSDNSYSTNTLAGSIAQSGVSHYVQPLAGFSPRYPSAAELNYAGISPTYFEIPNYNYSIHQQDPNLYWGIAKGAKPPFPAGSIERGPSAFEQSNGFLNSLEAGNAGKLHSICIGDEEAYSTTMTGYMKGWFDVIRAKYPNVLFHSNQYIGQWNASQMSTYMQTAQPDLLTFDMYYFHYVYGPAPGAGNTYTRMFQDLQVYRQIALGGYDGSGTNPIGFGGYLQAFSGDNTGTYAAYRPSESEFNLNTFAYLTMGAKWLNVWIYHAIFWDAAAGQPTPQYYQVANLGKAVAKLSPHLARLRTSDLRFIPGQNTGGVNASPNNITAWNTTADPYVKNITAENLGTFNNGLRGDVMVGYFKPVPGLDNTAGITMAPVSSMNARYFMLLNGLTKPNGPGNNSTDTVLGKAMYTKQKITLAIDFGSGPVDTLYRVRKTDGIVEMVPLSPAGGSQYTLTDTLDGGVADLFYWKNQGAPQIPPGAGASLQLSAGSVSGGNVTSLNGTNAYTIETWAKFNSIGDWHTVFSKMTDVNNRILLQVHSSKSLYVIVSNGSNNYGQTAVNTITTGQWYHLAVVYDGTQSTNAGRLKLYINGNLVPLSFQGTIPATTSSTNTAPLLFGSGCSGCTANYMNGIVDDIRVWNTPLTAATVTAWKDKKLGTCHPNSNNLQVYWTFNNHANPAVASPGLNTTNTGVITNGMYNAADQATTDSGCLSSLQNANTMMTSVAKNETTNGARVYPNPVSNVLNAEFDSKTTGNALITIFDVNGNAVYNSRQQLVKGMNRIQVNFAAKPPGYYILKIATKADVRQFTVIKQ
jgi:Concanavalin A-like lectin/glucanases superfamily/Secretion system C-terminal sorting domain